MSTPAFSLARAGLALVILALLPDSSMAQQRLELAASLAAVEAYDDNLFFSPDAPERDEIWRLSPRLSLSRRSTRLTLRARYGLDAERYRRHPSLDTPLAGQEGSLEMTWTPSRRVVASTTASYAESQSPGMLNVLTGLQLGRHRARRLFARQWLSWQMGERTSGTLEPTFTQEEVAGLPRTDTEGVVVGVERRMGASDRARLSYTARRFGFEGSAVFAHVVALGWSREITPLAHFEVEAGPRFSEGVVGAEVSARLRHHFARGEAVLAYVHTQTTVLGEAGPVITQGVTAAFRRRLCEALTVGAGPTFARVQGRGSEFDVFRVNLDVEWRLTRRLSLSASHQFNFQSGMPGLTTRSAEIAHNAFMVRAVASSSGH